MNDFKDDENPIDQIDKTEEFYHCASENSKERIEVEISTTQIQQKLFTYFSSLVNGNNSAINDIAQIVMNHRIVDIELFSKARYPILIFEALPEIENKFNAYIVLSVITSRKYDIYSEIFNYDFFEIIIRDANSSPNDRPFAFKTLINIINSNVEYFYLCGSRFVEILSSYSNLKDTDDPFMLLSSMLFKHTFPKLPVEKWFNIIDMGMNVLYGANANAIQKVLVGFASVLMDEKKAIQILNLGLLDHILSFLESGREDLSMAGLMVTEALTNTDNEEIINYLVQVEMINRIKPFLFHENPLVISVTISILLVLIRINHEKLITQFLEPEIFLKLIETANEGGTTARENVTKFFCEAILSTFEPEIWAGIFENGGLDVLLEFLEDDSSPILKDVVAALHRVLMKDGNFAIALSESNVLEILAEHSLSKNCSCPEDCAQFRKDIKIALREKQHDINM